MGGTFVYYVWANDVSTLQEAGIDLQIQKNFACRQSWHSWSTMKKGPTLKRWPFCLLGADGRNRAVNLLITNAKIKLLLNAN